MASPDPLAMLVELELKYFIAGMLPALLSTCKGYDGLVVLTPTFPPFGLRSMPYTEAVFLFTD